MEHASSFESPFPWRAATLVASTVAAVELVVLAVGGTVLLTHPFRHHTTLASTEKATPVHHTAAATARPAVVVRPVAQPPSHPLLARGRVHVLVLNGNGVQGAAASTASRLSGLGYRISGSTNAERHDYARSIVMYRPGYGKEARRLARDGHFALVSPVDGLTPAALKGSQLVVILGR